MTTATKKRKTTKKRKKKKQEVTMEIPVKVEITSVRALKALLGKNGKLDLFLDRALEQMYLTDDLREFLKRATERFFERHVKESLDAEVSKRVACISDNGWTRRRILRPSIKKFISKAVDKEVAAIVDAKLAGLKSSVETALASAKKAIMEKVQREQEKLLKSLVNEATTSAKRQLRKAMQEQIDAEKALIRRMRTAAVKQQQQGMRRFK